MDDSNISLPASPKSRSLRSVLLVALISMLVGGALLVWGLSRWDGARAYLFGTPRSAPVAVAAQTSNAPAAAPPMLAVPQVAVSVTEQRLADLEQRLEMVSRNNNAQSQNSERAEGLLLAFAARRALDRGLALGYVEAQLSARFGRAQPRAVAVILAAARQPVTLDELKGGLADLAPQLSGAGADTGWWDGIKRGLSGLIIVREAGAPSPQPADRLTRAIDSVAVGRVDQALAEVARLPNRQIAEPWIVKARRYIEAYRALDLIEAEAIIGTSREAPAAETAPALVLPEPGVAKPEVTAPAADVPAPGTF